MDPNRTGSVWPVTGGPLFIAHPTDNPPTDDPPAEAQSPESQSPEAQPADTSVVHDGQSFMPTDYCRGPWNPLTLHGGPVVGLLAHAVEQLVGPESGLTCTRLTVEMFAPVPLDLLVVDARVIKPGRRTMVVDSTIAHDGVVIARASSLWARSEGLSGASGGVQAWPRAEDNNDPRTGNEFDYPNPGFNCDTCDLRYVQGSHETPGSGVSWIRLNSPLVEGETNSALVMAATVSDLAAAAGWEPAPNGNHYINPDVTLQLARLPIGSWIAIEAHVEHGATGTALLTSQLFDDVGPFGRVLQSLVEAPIDLSLSADPTT